MPRKAPGILPIKICQSLSPSSQPLKLPPPHPPQRSWTWSGEPRSIGSLGPSGRLGPLGFEVHQVHLLQIQHDVPTLHAPAHLTWDGKIGCDPEEFRKKSQLNQHDWSGSDFPPDLEDTCCWSVPLLPLCCGADFRPSANLTWIDSGRR